MRKYKYKKQKTIKGKRKVFYADTKRELNKKIEEYNWELKQREKFEDIAWNWKEQHFPTLAYNSTKNYEGAFKRIVAEFGETYITDLKPLDIDNYIKRLGEQQFAIKTIRNTRNIINMICSYAVIHGYIMYNPCAEIKVKKGVPEKPRKKLTQEQIDIVLKNKDAEFGLYPLFLLYTGMRPNEPLALRGEDIDLKNRTISITKSVYWDAHSQPHTKPPKTESGKRKVVIVDELMPYLQDLKPNQLLFNIDGKMFTKSQYDYHWKHYRLKAGLQIKAYQLRHTYASMLNKIKATDKEIQYLMGHSDPVLTKKTYMHIDDDDLANIDNVLNDFVHTKHIPQTKTPINTDIL